MGILAVSAADYLRFVANFNASLKLFAFKVRAALSVLIVETSAGVPFLRTIILLVIYFIANLFEVKYLA